jgi:DNA repair protein RecN (Recombination protein N)
MLTGLWIRDVVLIEALDLSVGPGLTALTGETGAGKSILLDALGLATGARAESGLVRRGAAQASASAAFSPPPGHPVWSLLEARGLEAAPGEDLILRRVLSADGRSRAFVNDQPSSVGALREIGALLIEVHGQHETVGLLDARTHRDLLDAYGGHAPLAKATAQAWTAWREAQARLEALGRDAAALEAEAEEAGRLLAELDALAPEAGEETALAEKRAVLGAAEKALADINLAGEALEGLPPRLASALRALGQARSRALAAGAAAEGPAVQRLAEAEAALDAVFSGLQEAEAAVESAASAFDFRADDLEKAEERLFALRAAARRMGCAVEALPERRQALAERLARLDSGEAELAAARREAAEAEGRYIEASAALTAARRTAAEALALAVESELPPLKLERARFQVALETLAPDRAGPGGCDRILFEVATNPGAPFGDLTTVASGGELARFALALKASLAGRGGEPPLMIFDEVDQGVVGAVADAVGLRLRRLAREGQVLVVTHSPQVAARADAHWRIAKAGDDEALRTRVEVLDAAAREEEIARMLAGAQVTDEARAAARALMHA